MLMTDCRLSSVSYTHCQHHPHFTFACAMHDHSCMTIHLTSINYVLAMCVSEVSELGLSFPCLQHFKPILIEKMRGRGRARECASEKVQTLPKAQILSVCLFKLTGTIYSNLHTLTKKKLTYSMNDTRFHCAVCLFTCAV